MRAVRTAQYEVSYPKSVEATLRVFSFANLELEGLGLPLACMRLHSFESRLLFYMLSQSKGTNQLFLCISHMICQGNKTVYSSKSGSKSFDELDDILSEKPKKQSSKKRGRRTLSSISGSDLMKAKERRKSTQET